MKSWTSWSRRVSWIRPSALLERHEVCVSPSPSRRTSSRISSFSDDSGSLWRRELPSKSARQDRRVARDGRTILFVSHTWRRCNRSATGHRAGTGDLFGHLRAGGGPTTSTRPIKPMAASRSDPIARDGAGPRVAIEVRDKFGRTMRRGHLRRRRGSTSPGELHRQTDPQVQIDIRVKISFDVRSSSMERTHKMGRADQQGTRICRLRTAPVRVFPIASISGWA